MRILRTASLLLLAVLGGCTGGDDDSDRQPREGDPSATLSSGSYEVSRADVHSDGCESGVKAGDLNGGVIPVVVTGNDVDINQIPATLSNGNITGSRTLTGVDLIGDGSCLGDVTTSEEGTAPETDMMELVESITVSNPSGAGCSAVPVDLPCTTSYFARLTKL